MRASVLRKTDHWLQVPASEAAVSKRTVAALAERFAAAEPESEGVAEARGQKVKTADARPAAKRAAVPLKFLIAALAGVALLPTAILFVLFWQDMMRPRADSAVSGSDRVARPAGLAQPVPAQTAPEIVLSSPEKIAAKTGEEIDFPIAIDTTEQLPSRSVIAVSAMPEGASFSEGRPYGATGWSLRPDEIGELRMRLPDARSGASDIHIELLAADGTVLAQSETRLNIAADSDETEAVSVVEANPFQQVAQAEAARVAEALPPGPERKPAASTKAEPSVKVVPVKVVTIKPPGPTRPHGGAFALGDAAEPPAEWVEIVSAVDMHAGPKQTSETVKVVEKGLKLRVAARERNWVQVTDPATSASGWIYSRFLKATAAPGQ
jgi:hypothetical protein